MSDRRLARVIDFIASHYAEPLTLEGLAAEACVSKFHFNRLFREKVGQSPLRYLAAVRLDAARRALLSSDVPISEIGRACGYPLPSHFSSAFTARFGEPPQAMRRRQRHR